MQMIRGNLAAPLGLKGGVMSRWRLETRADGSIKKLTKENDMSCPWRRTITQCTTTCWGQLARKHLYRKGTGLPCRKVEDEPAMCQCQQQAGLYQQGLASRSRPLNPPSLLLSACETALNFSVQFQAT